MAFYGLGEGGFGASNFGGGVMEPRGATSFGGGYQDLVNQYLAQNDQSGAPMTPDAWAESMADPQRSRNLIQYFGGNYANYLSQWRRRARGVRPSARDKALYNRMTLGTGAAANPASDDPELDRMLGGARTPVTQGRTYAGRRVGGDTISSTDIRGNVTTRPTGIALDMSGQPLPLAQQTSADQNRLIEQQNADQNRLIALDQLPYAREFARRERESNLLKQQAEIGAAKTAIEGQKTEQQIQQSLQNLTERQKRSLDPKYFKIAKELSDISQAEKSREFEVEKIKYQDSEKRRFEIFKDGLSRNKDARNLVDDLTKLEVQGKIVGSTAYLADQQYTLKNHLDKAIIDKNLSLANTIQAQINANELAIARSFTTDYIKDANGDSQLEDDLDSYKIQNPNATSEEIKAERLRLLTENMKRGREFAQQTRATPSFVPQPNIAGTETQAPSVAAPTAAPAQAVPTPLVRTTGVEGMEQPVVKDRPYVSFQYAMNRDRNKTQQILQNVIRKDIGIDVNITPEQQMQYFDNYENLRSAVGTNKTKNPYVLMLLYRKIVDDNIQDPWALRFKAWAEQHVDDLTRE